MKALITAGGRATRMRPITYTINKHLIPLANRPMIVHAIEKIVDAGIKDIVINVNPGETEIQQAVGDGSRWGAIITYVEQVGGPKGLAHIVKNAREVIGNEPFLFYLGDNIILGSLRRFVEKFETEKLDVLLALSRVRDPQRFGVPVIENGRITKVLEKPEHPPSDYAVTGIYLCQPSIFEAVEKIQPSSRGEYEFPDAVSVLIDEGRPVGYEEITGWWKDTGKPEDLLEGNALFLDEMSSNGDLKGVTLDDSVRLQGKIQVGKGTVLGPNVLIRGPVVIGENCRIAEAYIGPYTSIGNNVHILDSEIEHTVVFEGANINCGERIVDSLIGKNVSITAARRTMPRGHKLFVGDNSQIEL
jgi:glucose-1-phosphate thymidylyltransferase